MLLFLVRLIGVIRFSRVSMPFIVLFRLFYLVLLLFYVSHSCYYCCCLHTLFRVSCVARVSCCVVLSGCMRVVLFILFNRLILFYAV